MVSNNQHNFLINRGDVNNFDLLNTNLKMNMNSNLPATWYCHESIEVSAEVQDKALQHFNEYFNRLLILQSPPPQCDPMNFFL